MALHVVHGRSAEDLVTALAETLLTPPDDPLASEQIAVHDRGMERWVSQSLSHHLGAVDGAGVCANIEFPTPGTIFAELLSDSVTEDSRWHPRRLVWDIAALFEDHPDVLPPGVGKLTSTAARLKRIRTIANTFYRYTLHRPEMVLAWLDGGDTGPNDALLEPSDRWQPQAFRQLHRIIGQLTPAEAVRGWLNDSSEAVQRAAERLPQRISFFGFASLPMTHLTAITAVSKWRDVTMYLPHPSPALWAAHRGVKLSTVGAGGTLQMPIRDVVNAPRSPLLASWGNDIADTQLVLQSVCDDVSAVQTTRPTTTSPLTLLQRLQMSVTENAPVDLNSWDGDEADTTGTRDARSLVFHSCHNRTRQVQVLRDEILRRLDDDPTLEPRDIVVMCPNIEAYAPLISAHLATASSNDDRPDIRVRLADHELRQRNPLLNATDQLLLLAAGRITLDALFGFIAMEPVRLRFLFSDDDLETLLQWCKEAGFRWGLDHTAREQSGVPTMANSAPFALDRMSLGAMMPDAGYKTVASITPLDHVEGNRAAMLGRFMELVDRLRAAVNQLREERSLSEWCDVLSTATTELFSAPPEELWQRRQLSVLLADVQEEAGTSTNVAFGLTTLRDVIGDLLRGKPSWVDHRTGDLTVCSLSSLQNVPHRVVILLGMDDGEFPRSNRPWVGDVLASTPTVGDVSTSTKDRQLFLDALMSAKDAIVMLYSGQSDRTGGTRPPCVVVNELRHILDTARPGLAETLTTTQPLTAFEPAGFSTDVRRYDPQAYSGAAALVAGVHPDDSVPQLLPVEVSQNVSVLELQRFVADPVKAFFNNLGVYPSANPEPHERTVVVTASGLDQWLLGETLLRDRVDDDTAIAHLRGAGAWPPEPFGENAVASIQNNVQDIQQLETALGLDRSASKAREVVDVAVGEWTITGSVSALSPALAVHRTYSKTKPTKVFNLYLDVLVRTLADPSRPAHGVLLGRDSRGSKRAHGVRIGPFGNSLQTRQDAAIERLQKLLAVYQLGMRTPLVAPASVAAAYVQARIFNLDPGPIQAAEQAWTTDPYAPFDNADQDPSNRLLFRSVAPFSAVRQRKLPDEVHEQFSDEPNAFEQIAMQLWKPVYDAARTADHDELAALARQEEP